MKKSILIIVAVMLSEILLATSMITEVQAWSTDCECDHYHEGYEDDMYTGIGMHGSGDTVYWIFERGYGGTYPPFGLMHCHWRVDWGDYNLFYDSGSTWDEREDPKVYYQNAWYDDTASSWASGLSVSLFPIPNTSPPQWWWCGSTWAVITD